RVWCKGCEKSMQKVGRSLCAGVSRRRWAIGHLADGCHIYMAAQSENGGGFPRAMTQGVVRGWRRCSRTAHNFRRESLLIYRDEAKTGQELRLICFPVEKTAIAKIW